MAPSADSKTISVIMDHFLDKNRLRRENLSFNEKIMELNRLRVGLWNQVA